MISLQICKNSVAELWADHRSPVSWTLAPAQELPDSPVTNGAGLRGSGSTAWGCRWVLGALGCLPHLGLCRKQWHNTGRGRRKGTARTGSSHQTALSVEPWTSIKITVGNHTLGFCCNLGEVLTPLCLSLLTSTINMVVQWEELWWWTFHDQNKIIKKSYIRMWCFEHHWKFFMEAKVLTRKMCSTLSQNSGFVQEIRREIIYVSWRRLWWDDHRGLFYLKSLRLKICTT